MTLEIQPVVENAVLDGIPGHAIPPLEFRSSNVANVKFAKRIIEIIAVPYDEEAIVEYRSELWHESFARQAFDGIEKRNDRVVANRDHDNLRLVGKVFKFHPSRQAGLVAEVKFSETVVGNETLALADDDVLSASVGFAARGADQVFDRPNKRRRIMRAFVDHLTLTPTPAYRGAGVLSLREGIQAPDAAHLPTLVTPALDELLAWQRARKH
jgi:phage head maturation protease